MGTKRNVTVAEADEVKIVENVDTPEVSEQKKQTVVKKARSKRYAAANSKVDKTKQLPLDKAVELVQKLSYTKFDGTVEAHLVVKEAGLVANVTFPHSTGKTVRVALVTDELLAEIEEGQINFDVLVAAPADMAKLTKFARTLGPKGLMPNPKSGTLTSNPEGKKKELEGGRTNIKTEKKAPLIHVSVGKVSMKPEALTENIQALLSAFKGQVKKVTLSASMSPSVKVLLEK